jgi:hypothetical protein
MSLAALQIDNDFHYDPADGSGCHDDAEEPEKADSHPITTARSWAGTF